MNQYAAAEAAKLREEARQCRAVAMLMSLKDDARRLLDLGRTYEARAEAIERALGAQQSFKVA